MIREASGSTPLHLAVKGNYPKLTKLLAKAGPAEALMLEDGVGSTPLEYATRQAFLTKMDTACGFFRAPQELNLNYHQRPFDPEKQEAELSRLRATTEQLLREGRLKNGTKLAKKLAVFADRLEVKIAKERATIEAKQKEEEDKFASSSNFSPPKDSGNPSETLKVLSEAIAARPALRHLIHLSDVHHSVTKSLEQYKQTKKSLEVKDDDGIPDEEEATVSSLSQSYETPYKVASGASVPGRHWY